jgi:hypothetical protein
MHASVVYAWEISEAYEPPTSATARGLHAAYHLGQHHPTEVGPYLARMRIEDITAVAAETYEVVEVVDEDSQKDARKL